MIIQFSPLFEKHYRKLPQRIKDKAKKRISIFQEDQFHPSLKTHKLVGNNKEVWSFSIDYSYRIKFIFLNEGTVAFLDVGGHEIYY